MCRSRAVAADRISLFGFEIHLRPSPEHTQIEALLKIVRVNRFNPGLRSHNNLIKTAPAELD
jgi:hypothetical protein